MNWNCKQTAAKESIKYNDLNLTSLKCNLEINQNSNLCMYQKIVQRFVKDCSNMKHSESELPAAVHAYCALNVEGSSGSNFIFFLVQNLGNCILK